MRYLSEEQRRQMVDEFMRQVNASRARQIPERQSLELDPESLKVLIKLETELGITQMAVYRTLELHPAEGKAAMDDLLARGFIKRHYPVRKGRGGQPVVMEVLPAGKAALEKRGIPPGERKLKRGGFLHEVYARHVERFFRAQGYRCQYEWRLGDKAFDLVCEDTRGNLHGVEICLSGSVEWTAQQAIKGAGVEGIVEVIVACERRSFLKAVMEKVSELDGLGLYRKKIVGKLLSEYVVCE